VTTGSAGSRPSWPNRSRTFRWTSGEPSASTVADRRHVQRSLVVARGLPPRQAGWSSRFGSPPFDAWRRRGLGGRVWVKGLRDADAVPDAPALDRRRSLSHAWLGRHYELQFRWDRFPRMGKGPERGERTETPKLS
jgi:hypothetical protein